MEVSVEHRITPTRSVDGEYSMELASSQRVPTRRFRYQSGEFFVGTGGLGASIKVGNEDYLNLVVKGCPS